MLGIQIYNIVLFLFILLAVCQFCGPNHFIFWFYKFPSWFGLTVKCTQPHVFKKMRSELTTMWNSTNKTKSTRRSSIRSGLPASTKDVHTTSVHDFFSLSNQEKPNMKVSIVRCTCLGLSESHILNWCELTYMEFCNVFSFILHLCFPHASASFINIHEQRQSSLPGSQVITCDKYLVILVFYLQDLLQAVLPFDLLLDRKRRSYFLNNLHGSSETSVPKPKIVDDAAVALASLAACEEELEQELLISTS